MNLPDTVAFLTWLSQTDHRIQVTDANIQVWNNALATIPTPAVKDAALEHYRTNETASPTPAILRKIALTERERNLAKQSAITANAPTIKNGLTYRQRNPQQWDQLFEQGRADGNADRGQATNRRNGES